MTSGKHPDRFGSLEFLPADRNHSANKDTMSPQVLILPGNVVFSAGEKIRRVIRVFGTQGTETPMELQATLSSLSPLAPASTSTSVLFTSQGQAESREVSIQADVTPGRYRLDLSVYGSDHNLLAQERQVVFVYPRF